MEDDQQWKTKQETVCGSISKLSRLMRVLLLLLYLTGACCCLLATSVLAASSSLTQLPPRLPTMQRCSGGAPLQWRPYLDAASKAHLAPGVALATLRNLSLILLTSNGGLLLQPHNLQQQLGQHAQNVNNVGAYFVATFELSKVLKNSNSNSNNNNNNNNNMNLQANQMVRLFYKVSASLSTTIDLMQLASSNSGVGQTGSGGGGFQRNHHLLNSQQQQLMNNLQQESYRLKQSMQRTCVLDLSEHELQQKADKLFKLNQNYVLFLDSLQPHHQQQQQVLQPVYRQTGNQAALQAHQQVSMKNHWPPMSDIMTLQPFATHEPLTNQTSRSLRKILCKNCAQVPQIHLVNGTFVSVAQQQQQFSQQQQQRRIRLDCRVTGYPAPWIQWYRNGKLLRNRRGRVQVRANKWRKRHDVRLSRLELELRPGRNETGVYECRAMNVAAREPVVAAYTLLVLPGNYALFPDQPASPAPASTTPRPASTPTPQVSTNPTPAPSSTSSTTAGGAAQAAQEQQSQVALNTIQAASESPPVVGQPCPREAHDNFCLNKGTCVLIGHIAEYFCNCAEGYHGHRCEYKSLGHQQAAN